MRFPRQTHILRLCVRELQRTPRRNFSTTRAAHDTGYYLLLPSVPEDTAESNSLLQTTGLPQYDKIADNQVRSGLGKLTLDYETAFYRFEEEIQNSKEEKTFASVFDPLDRLNHPLIHAFTTAKTLNAGRNSDILDGSVLRSEEAVMRCRSLANYSAPLRNAVREISKEQTDLNEAQQRILSKFLLEARLNGSDLNSKDDRQYRAIVNNRQETQNKFRSNLVVSSSQFYSSIVNPSFLDDAPAEVLGLFSKDKSSPSVTLKTPVYNAFMKYCRDTRMRWNAWHAYVGRAGFRNPDLNNSLVIEDIRQLRSKEAKLFGYENYAALSMETKMARSVKNVLALVSEMTIPAKAKCQTELMELQTFAGAAGFPVDLQVWDIAYWRRKYREATFKLPDAEVKQFFPLSAVLEGLFRLCTDLFGVVIKQDTAAAPVWHPDVKFYRVFDKDDKELAGFYLDPYARPGQKESTARLQLGQNRSDAAGSSPLCTLIFSFQPPKSPKPALLTYEDVNVLFQKFGTALQHMLTTVPYGEASGLNNVEWDALNVSGSTLQMFLRNPIVLKRLSKHVDTGKEISDDLMQSLLRQEQHLSSLDLLSEMYFSVLDLSLYTKPDFWQDIMKDVWRDFMPFALDKADAHPCGFSHIFIGNYAAAYYSFLWSEIVAADVYSAFNEADFSDEKEIKQVGKRFRETFLSLGGGCHAAEVFRRFRGREPSPQPLLRLNDIES